MQFFFFGFVMLNFYFSLSYKIPWSIVSNAALKFKRLSTQTFPESRLAMISLKARSR